MHPTADRIDQSKPNGQTSVNRLTVDANGPEPQSLISEVTALARDTSDVGESVRFTLGAAA